MLNCMGLGKTPFLPAASRAHVLSLGWKLLPF